MTTYLDASVLVSLLVDDANTAQARELNSRARLVGVSHWTLVECSSAFSKLMRMGRLSAEEVAELEQMLDRWTSRGPRMVPTTIEDFEEARSFVRRSVSGLRAADALHLAIAARERLELATFDLVLARSAAEFGVPVAEF